MAGSSPIHCHIGTVPPSEALATSESAYNPLALKQIGQTRYVPPAATNRAVNSASGGHPAQATPTATDPVTSRTASLVRNISVVRPCSAAPTATRNATVTFSGSSSPVIRLITALLIVLPPAAPGAAPTFSSPIFLAREAPAHGAGAPFLLGPVVVGTGGFQTSARSGTRAGAVAAWLPWVRSVSRTVRRPPDAPRCSPHCHWGSIWDSA